ncbi:MAG: hypothetical protein AAFX59_12310 [Pseudomonadota bacterium]
MIGSALWTPADLRALRPADHLWAALTMGVVPGAIAWAIGAGGPWCHAKRAANLFEWGCLFPMTVIIVCVGFLALVPIAVFAAWKGRGPRRIGWMVAILAGGGLAQLVLVSSYFLFLVRDSHNPLTTWEALTMPWPFLAGMICAAAYWAVLWARRNRA